MRVTHLGLISSLVFLASCAMGGMAKSPAMTSAAVGAAPSGAPTVTASDATTTQIPEQLVVEGSLVVEVGEVGDIVPGLRTFVEAAGGRVITEQVSGGETSWSATLKLRLPPAQVEPVVAWLAGRGDILDKRINATDVSRELFDQELALENLTATSDRLQALLAQPGLGMNDVLAIEKELTRIRGEIEAIKGAQRFLKDRVALATLDVSLRRRDGAIVTVARAKFYPGVRVTSLTLLDPEGRQRTRFGGSLVLHSILRNHSLEVDLYEAAPAMDGSGAKAAVIATTGGAAYSDFLGGGRRRTLNPYLGLRAGYAYLDSSRFVIQAEAGLELWKSRHAVIDASVRGTGLIGKNPDAAVVASTGVVVAF
ncbi:MAG: DUF4349 domain-containing protein [Kofleriaceae bacterium]|nr:MAG: DUF4349 domain-containing protein [Kofleriaceae bacterium]MBZ0238806.1 DUF4349 domain-containing protein [Kofleriaceae bacterium]